MAGSCLFCKNGENPETAGFFPFFHILRRSAYGNQLLAQHMDHAANRRKKPPFARSGRK